MPHVDEGTLHALLDGALKAEDPARAATVQAHLEGCPDCRALLDDAAAIRDGATGILAALETDARPDFQEVLTRAGLAGGAATGLDTDTRRRDRLRRQARATRAAAWAATVVLALGTGYLVRDRMVADRPATDAVTMSAERAADQAPADRHGEDRSDTGTEPRVEPGTTSRDAAPQVAEAGPLEAPSADARADAATPQVIGGRAAPAEPPRIAGEPVSPADVGEAARRVTPPPEAGRTEAATLPEDQVLRRRISAVPPPPPPALALEHVVVTAAAWRSVTPGEARELLDGPFYVLPGADIVRVEAVGPAPEREIRSVQRMDGGLELTVTQRPVDPALPGAAVELDAVAEPSVDADPGDPGRATHTVSVLLDGFTLTVSGPLPAEAMQALARAARAD